MSDLIDSPEPVQAAPEAAAAALEKLAASEARFRTLVEGTDVILWEYDETNDTCKYISPQAARFGYALEEWQVPNFWANHLHPEDREWATRYSAEEIDAGRNHRMQYRFATARGAYVWIDDVVTLDRSATGKKVVRGVMIDITDRKQADQALKESEERFSKAFHASPASTCLTEYDTGRFVDVNERFTQLTGYSRGEILGRTTIEIGMVPDQAARECLLRRVESRQPLRDLEFEIVVKDGRRLTLLASIEQIQIGGKRYLLTINQDITEQKHAETIRAQLEAQLRQAQKMEAVGTLAGGIAHDFNNILSSIIGYTEIARCDCGGNQEVEASLDVVLQASRRAKELIHQLLTFSRRGNPEMLPLNVAELLSETLTLLRGMLPPSITLETSVDDSLPQIQADAAQLQRVLINLATNAAHAMRDTRDARLRISARSLAVTEDFAAMHPGLAPGPHVELRVQDNGCGVPESEISRLFDPFFTTKAPGEGTGLGLSVVHGIIRNHQGGIRVESRPGAGTTFFLYLPAGGARVRPAKKSSTLVMARAGERVLFVDDEPSLCVVGKRVLERAGYSVTVSSSAAEAIQMLREDPDRFDLIVTDLAMPGTAGLSLVKQFRSLHPTLPILLTTGNADRVSEADARTLGISEILLKPSDASTLSEAVSRTLADRPAQPRR